MDEKQMDEKQMDEKESIKIKERLDEGENIVFSVRQSRFKPVEIYSKTN